MLACRKKLVAERVAEHEQACTDVLEGELRGLRQLQWQRWFGARS
jgi:hypothetical protein